MAKLGYSFDPNQLSSFKAECFVIIAGEISEQEKAEMKKAKRKK